MSTRREIIGVLGSGTQEHRAWVEPLARWIAGRGFHLLTGAGGGVMRAAAEAFVAVEGRAGLSLGIVPGAVVDGVWSPKPGYPNPAVELPILTHLPLSGAQGTEPMSRNHLNVLTAHALVALPGGMGTVSEVVLALRYGKPVILFGPREGFRDFPPEVERTDTLARVSDFLISVLRESAPSSG
jgi:predicted Rossmann-fold nucleotide-binding protein